MSSPDEFQFCTYFLYKSIRCVQNGNPIQYLITYIPQGLRTQTYVHSVFKTVVCETDALV